MTLRLRYCTIEFHPWGARTLFKGGASIDARPHDTHHYHVIAHRCGYGDDTLRYCQEHEVCHSLVAEWFYNQPSRVLLNLALGFTPRLDAPFEEVMTQTLQRFLRANERPIVGDVNWDGLRDYARSILGD